VKRDHQQALTSGHVQPGLLYEEIEDDELWPPLAQRCRTTERTPKEGMEFEEVCVGRVGGKAGEEKRSSGNRLGVSAWTLKAIPWSQITHFSCVRSNRYRKPSSHLVEPPLSVFMPIHIS